LQHKGHKAGKFDIDYRGHKRCVRVLDHLGENGDLGSWKIDPDAIGDLMLGLCWPQDPGKRPVPMWSFGFPVVMQGGGKKNVATQGGGAGPGSVPTPGGGGGGGGGAGGGRGGGGGGGNMEVLPISDLKDSPDSRMKPIPVQPRILKAKGPQNPPQPPPPPAGGGGKPVDPNRIDSGGAVLYLGIGGSIGGFGGQGVGRGSSFPTFGGVRSNFS